MNVYRFWKPYNVLTKFTDAEQRPTLADYVSIPDIYAAGRLDRDSEGLLLLTDDGALSHRLTDPRFAHPRTYWAQVERIPDAAALDQLRRGVDLSDKGKKWTTRPAQAELLADAAGLAGTFRADPLPQKRADGMDRVDDHRRAQPSSAADDGGGRLPDAAPRPLADRLDHAGGAATGRSTAADAR